MNNIILSSEFAIAKTLVSQADDLANEYENFHNNYIVGGRAALYETLGKMYALAQKLDHAVDKQEQIASMRKILSEKYDIRTQENTSDTAVLVRYITHADRKTTHVYVRSIEAAKVNQIPVAQFAGYLEEAGGVERIRASSAMVPSNSSQDDLEGMIDLAKKYLIARSELPLGSFKLPKNLSASAGQGALTHFICHERNGRQYVLAQLNIDKGREAAMVKDFAKEFCADKTAAKKGVRKFYAKAMAKRKQRTIKEIAKQRPEVAASILRNMSR